MGKPQRHIVEQLEPRHLLWPVMSFCRIWCRTWESRPNWWLPDIGIPILRIFNPAHARELPLDLMW